MAPSYLNMRRTTSSSSSDDDQSQSLDVSIIFKAIASRLLFFAHGILVVYLYNSNQTNSNYWILILPLAFLFVETILTICFRRGREYKYVWPSGFLYITCVVPIIWLTEFDLYETQLSNRNAEKAKMKLDDKQTEEQKEMRRKIVVYVIDAARGSQTLKKVCELGLIICIIIARWCMPRGELTKDQLSALLLVYVGNSADILELFDTFEEPEVVEKKPVMIAVLAIFTWSMYQFALITTATIKGEDMPDNNRKPRHPLNARMSRVSPANIQAGQDFKRNKALVENYIGNIRTKNRKISVIKQTDPFNRGRGKKVSVVSPGVAPINESATNDKKAKIKQREMHGELYQILVTLLMQDGPFLILRLYLLIELNVSSEMHIFFTCKNAIVSLLLIYRLLILSCHGKDEVDDDLNREDASTKLHNIQVAMELNKIRDIKLADVSVQ